MISFLIGFMIMPALVGIVLVITWAVEYFHYVAALLKAHYASKYATKQLKKQLAAAFLEDDNVAEKDTETVEESTEETVDTNETVEQ